MIAVGDHLFGQCPEVLVRASSPLGGGLGGSKEELCGVLSGATLILGALKGRLAPTEDDKPFYESVRHYREGFQALAKSTQCKAIYDGFPEGHKRCWPIVAAGTRLLLEALEESR